MYVFDQHVGGEIVHALEVSERALAFEAGAAGHVDFYNVRAR